MKAMLQHDESSLMTYGLISKSRCKIECWRWSHCTCVEMTFIVIQAHRVLLASSSPYFKVGFTNCHTNSHQSVFFKREKRIFYLSRPCSQVVWRSPNGQRRTEELFRLIFMKMMTLMMRMMTMMTGKEGRIVKNKLSKQIVIDFFNSLKCFCFFILLNTLHFVVYLSDPGPIIVFPCQWLTKSLGTLLKTSWSLAEISKLIRGFVKVVT